MASGFVPSKKKAQGYSDFYRGNSNTLGAKVGAADTGKKPSWAAKMINRDTVKNTKLFKNRDETEEDDSLEARKKAIQRRLAGKKSRKA